MKTEKSLYQTLKNSLPKVHWQRIETGALGTGVPDVNACWQGNEFWIELKIGTIQSVNLSAQQCAWHTRRATRGGISWILIHDPSKHQIWCVPGSQSVSLRNRTLCSSSPTIHHQQHPFDWKLVLKQFCLTDRMTV
jgi:DNA-directed RNA polymerase specialized sigma54-like protein